MIRACKVGQTEQATQTLSQQTPAKPSPLSSGWRKGQSLGMADTPLSFLALAGLWGYVEAKGG